MKTASIASVKAGLSAFVEETKRGPVVVTKHGQPAAVLVRAPEDPDELERFLLAHNPRFQAVVARSRATPLMPHDQFWEYMESRYGPYPKTQPRRSTKRRKR